MSAISKKINVLRSRHVVIAAVIGVLLVVAAITYLVHRFNRAVTSEQGRQIAALNVEVETRDLRAPSSDGLTIYLDASDSRAVANFAGIDYLATSGGLIAIDDAGNVQRR